MTKDKKAIKKIEELSCYCALKNIDREDNKFGEFVVAIQKIKNLIQKKDKQIDLMAETILEDTEKLDTYWCNGCFKTAECSYKNPNECIKQYFEKQAKEV